MSKARNEVIAGDYTGRKVRCSKSKIIFDRPFDTPIEVDETTVRKYEVIDQDKTKDLASAFGRGLVGKAFLGTVGMMAGVISAQNSTAVIISIEFKNGDKSLIEVDKNIYKILLKLLFS